jgi:hypothetical protein
MPYDSALKEPGSKPNVGPLQFHRVVRSTAIVQPNDPRSVRAPPSEAISNVIERLVSGVGGVLLLFGEVLGVLAVVLAMVLVAGFECGA